MIFPIRNSPKHMSSINWLWEAYKENDTEKVRPEMIVRIRNLVESNIFY